MACDKAEKTHPRGNPRPWQILQEPPRNPKETPMPKISAAAVLAAVSASLMSAAPAQAQTPIKIMVGGIDKQIYLPAKLAAQLGFFKEQGLDLELFDSNPCSHPPTALLPRPVQAAVRSYDHTIDLHSKC